MKSDFLDPGHSRLRSWRTGLWPVLTLMGLASAHAGPFITSYVTTGSEVISGTTYDFTATLDLQSDYVPGTALQNSNFLRFVLVESDPSTGSLSELILSPADLDGNIEYTGIADTSFSVSTSLGYEFSDIDGIASLDVPTSAQAPHPSCPPQCAYRGVGGFGPTQRQPVPAYTIIPVSAYVISTATITTVSEPGTLMLLLGALVPLLLVSAKRLRILPMRSRRGTTAT
jgi:hypothetical protein